MNDPDLEWLFGSLPALLGERSGHGALIAALESGTPGNGSASSASAEGVVERFRPHAVRARRLVEAWKRVDPAHRVLLTIHYRPRGRWAPGIAAELGDLAGVTMHLAAQPAALAHACSNALHAPHATRIARELARGRRALAAAHAGWNAAKAAAVLTWIGG